MIRKISYIVISVAILISGYVAVKKLNYWERSIWIFKSSTSDQRFEGGLGRGNRENGRGIENYGRGGGERPADFRIQPGTRRMREIPDSMRARFEQQRQGGEFRGRFGDSGRGGFRDGKKVRLATVGWFLAVFAAFTVITIYADKALNLIRRE